MNSQENHHQYVQEEQQQTPRGATEPILLFHFPSLEPLFAPQSPAALNNMRAHLHRTCQDLERVIRQGSNHDAAAAQKALHAWQVALRVLSDLEKGSL
ncbi:MAG: hypothetical protein U0Y68_09855 [Blastocatellia bacterium]